MNTDNPADSTTSNQPPVQRSHRRTLAFMGIGLSLAVIVGVCAWLYATKKPDEPPTVGKQELPWPECGLCLDYMQIKLLQEDFQFDDWISRNEMPGGTVVITAKYHRSFIRGDITPFFNWVTFQIAGDRVIKFNSVRLNSQPPPPVAVQYPWPECEVIVRYMQIKKNDPDYQFEEWVDRRGDPGHVTVVARYPFKPPKYPGGGFGHFLVNKDHVVKVD
jgi:hypothetical protein